MSWLQKLLPPRIKSAPGERKTPVPEGLLVVTREGEQPAADRFLVPVEAYGENSRQRLRPLRLATGPIPARCCLFELIQCRRCDRWHRQVDAAASLS